MVVAEQDIIDESARGPRNFDEAGRFRWPKAILMLRAWRFEPKPLLLDVVDEQLPYHATSQAALFFEHDMSKVLRLNAIEAQLPDTDILFRTRRLDSALGQNGPTTGPVPSSWTGNTSRDTNQIAFTYAMRFGDSDIWKIGYATDIVKRANQLNEHIPKEVVSHCWRPKMTQCWESEVLAYEMEQRVLKALTDFRTCGERVQCSEADIWQAWKSGIGL